MASDLEQAVRAFAQAQAEVTQTQELLAEKRAEVPRARARLAAVIVEVYQRGMRQNEIVLVTGYTRESVRRILRAAGVEPD
ncbi:hypothetical protein [Actinoplanes sp. NPDC049265]|uniref:hypothetical protein n=1 Tax=Actinoplanes sp. NPDC049265 TaxID=3363902 RepID=UPI00371BF09D